MSKIADIFFLRSFLYTTATVATMAKIINDFQSNSNVECILDRLKTLDKNIVRAVESIMATIAGCTDLTVRLTPAYLSTLRITAATSKIMMNDGKIILDISNEEKQNLTVKDLLEKFEKAAGDEALSDRMILSN